MAAEFERSERYRTLKSPAARAIQRSLLASMPVVALLAIFDTPSRLGMAILDEQYLGVMLSLVLISSFLAMPATLRSPADRAPWYDLVLCVLSAVVGGYLIIFYPIIVNQIGELTWDKIILGAVAIGLVLEATRRLTGWILLIIAGFFILYAHYSEFFPGMFYAKGISWSQIAVHLYIDPNSLLGIPLAIVASIVIAFIFFGQMLLASGGGDFFTDLAKCALGRSRGGAAKISLLASALFGTISGSPVSNVVICGYVTIPMMIRTGYRPYVAAAVESVASTGGQLMPPVMGAAAFVMAEFLGWSYASVAIAALVPAFLYYLALFVQVDFEAGKAGIARLPEEEIPAVGGVLRKGWIFIIPMVAIIYFMFGLNLHASKAGFLAGGIALAASYGRRETRIGFRKLLAILEATGLALLEVAVVCAVAGVVIGVLTLTGAAFVFTMMVEQYGDQNLLLILALTGLVAMILGMGMPTTAVYVVVALALAPALVNLGVEPIAAHMFVFYYAMLSMITPPVCIAAFAGAAIAGSNPMRTGLSCVRLGFVAYLIPFMFVLNPLLLFQGPLHLVALATVAVTAGTVAAGVCIVGYFQGYLGWFARGLLALGSVAMLLPPGDDILLSWTAKGAGAAISAAVLFHDWRRARRRTEMHAPAVGVS